MDKTPRYGKTFLPTEYVDYTYDVRPSQRERRTLAALLIPKYEELVQFWTSEERTTRDRDGVEVIAEMAARHARTLVQLNRQAGKLPYYRPRAAGNVRVTFPLSVAA